MKNEVTSEIGRTEVVKICGDREQRLKDSLLNKRSVKLTFTDHGKLRGRERVPELFQRYPEPRKQLVREIEESTIYEKTGEDRYVLKFPGYDAYFLTTTGFSVVTVLTSQQFENKHHLLNKHETAREGEGL